MKNMARRQEEGVPIVNLLLYLLFSYIGTALVLLILAFLYYKFRFSEDIVSGGIVFTYVVAGFLSGFLAGKRMKQRKFLWGLLMGVAYYAVLLVLSLVVNHGNTDFSGSILTTLVLCAGGGMLGGMLS